jgi:hypothetical protein
VMRKMHADSLAALVKMAARLELPAARLMPPVPPAEMTAYSQLAL